MNKISFNTKNFRAISFVLIVFMSPITLAQEAKNDIVPLDSITDLWAEFLKSQDVDSLERLYVQCASIFHNSSIASIEGVAKHKVNFFGEASLFLQVVAGYISKHPSASYDDSVLYISNEVERIGEVYRNHGLAQMPPDNVSQDKELCIRENCFFKFTIFLEHMEFEANRCIRVARWSEA